MHARTWILWREKWLCLFTVRNCCCCCCCSKDIAVTSLQLILIIAYGRCRKMVYLSFNFRPFSINKTFLFVCLGMVYSVNLFTHNHFSWKKAKKLFNNIKIMPADNASKQELASIILTLEITCQFSKTHVRTNSLNAFSCLITLLIGVWKYS